MRIKSISSLFLYAYLFQIFLVPLAHYHHEHETDDKIRCTDCRSGEQLNSSCSENTPCENPAHHHHGKHKCHDSANCVVCKVLLQNIDNSPRETTNIYQDSFVTYISDSFFISYLFFTSFSNRSPPVQIS